MCFVWYLLAIANSMLSFFSLLILLLLCIKGNNNEMWKNWESFSDVTNTRTFSTFHFFCWTSKNYFISCFHAKKEKRFNTWVNIFLCRPPNDEAILTMSFCLRHPCQHNRYHVSHVYFRLTQRYVTIISDLSLP